MIKDLEKQARFLYLINLPIYHRNVTKGSSFHYVRARALRAREIAKKQF